MPYAGRYAGLCGLGCVSRYLGQLATTLCRFDAGERHLRAAIDCERRMQALPWEALAHRDLAVLCARRNGPGDRETARVERDTGRTIARKIDMEGLERSVGPLSAELASIDP